MRLYRRGKRYHLDVTVDGQRIREALDTDKYREALERASQLITEVKSGKASHSGASLKAFNKAADFYLGERELHCADKTVVTDRERAVALRRFFGDKQLSRITVQDVVEYQRKRIAQGIRARTINMEVGLLRRVLKRQKLWARLADDVRMLPERPTPPRILSPDEKLRLFQLAATRQEWSRVALAAIIAASTTMRGCEVKGLQWKNIDFNQVVPVFRIRRSTTKTDAGERVIPIHPTTQRVLMRAHEVARRRGAGEPEHYVFPACECGDFDPSRPIKTLRSAWRSLTRSIECPGCGRVQSPGTSCRSAECKADLKGVISPFHGLRFHDLRHLVVTELAERGVGEQTIMSISGHVNRKMLEHYSHPRLEAKHQAIITLDVPITDLKFAEEARSI